MSRMGCSSMGKDSQAQDGLIIVSRAWLYPYEDPASLLLKLADANGTDPKSIWELHQQELLPKSISARLRYRIQGATDSLIRIAPTGRYCPICISHGYRSLYCDVLSLVRCPLHGDSFLRSCRACGYPVLDNREWFPRPPFTCRNCAMPLGQKGLWHPMDRYRTPMLSNLSIRLSYGLVGRWIASLGREILSMPLQRIPQITTGNGTTWTCDPAADATSRLSLAFACFPPPCGLAHYFKWKPAKTVSLPAATPFMQDTLRANPVRFEYLLIRRRLLRVAKVTHCRCGNALHTGAWMPSMIGTGSLPIFPRCPFLLAIEAWRHHFEGMVSARPRQSVRLSERGEELLFAAGSSQARLWILLYCFYQIFGWTNQWVETRIKLINGPFSSRRSIERMALMEELYNNSPIHCQLLQPPIGLYIRFLDTIGKQGSIALLTPPPDLRLSVRCIWSRHLKEVGFARLWPAWGAFRTTKQLSRAVAFRP